MFEESGWYEISGLFLLDHEFSVTPLDKPDDLWMLIPNQIQTSNIHFHPYKNNWLTSTDIILLFEHLHFL